MTTATKTPVWPLVIALVLVWLAMMAYFWEPDPEAFQVALVLPPIFGLALILSLRSRSTMLPIFLTVTFVSHAVAPSFFFEGRTGYRPTGFGAVKAFQFQFGEFMSMYADLIFLIFALVAFVALLTLGRNRPRDETRAAGEQTAQQVQYDLALIAFLVCIAIPQTLIMFALRQGITGVVPESLPLRLTGLLYHSRMFLYPLLIFSAFSLGRRHTVTTWVVVAYSILAGLSASSRFVLLASSAGVLLFLMVDRKRMRLAAVGVALLAGFMLVSATRMYVYTNPDMGFVDLVFYSAQSLTTIQGAETQTYVAATIGSIANRLWGPQDIVLAAQYHVADRMQATWNYFTLGTVVPDLTYSFYGMVFDAGSGWGVGIGLLPWLIVLADGSWIVLIFLAFVLAVMLTVADSLLAAIRRRNIFGAPVLVQPLAFIAVYVLYSSTLNWFYQFLVCLFLLGAGLRALERRREHRAAQQTSAAAHA